MEVQVVCVWPCMGAMSVAVYGMRMHVSDAGCGECVWQQMRIILCAEPGDLWLCHKRLATIVAERV